MKTRLLTALGLSGTLFISAAALAAGGEQHSREFKELDQNNDGTLTYSEVRDEEVIENNWDSIDSDQDGLVDRIEFSAFEAGQAMERQEGTAGDDSGMRTGGEDDRRMDPAPEYEAPNR